jgi:hypothetical protein
LKKAAGSRAAIINERGLIMTKINKPNYLAKVKLLTKEEIERLFYRMGGKLDRGLEKHKLTVVAMHRFDPAPRGRNNRLQGLASIRGVE